mgnify:CR=1 FL=1
MQLEMNDNDEVESAVQEPTYIYRAVVTKVYDGDTITADVDVGLGVWVHGQKLRLYGIDTPEVRGEEREEGLKVRDFVRSQMGPGRDVDVIIRTYRDSKGKYGRWLAQVYYRSQHNPSGPMVSLNDTLLARGYAKRTPY